MGELKDKVSVVEKKAHSYLCGGAAMGWKSLGMGICVWSAIFAVVRLSLPKRSFDFCNRTVSLLHVAVSLSLSTLSVHDWHHIFWPLAAPASPLQMRTITVSLSYFIYDFFCCLLDTPVDFANALHHLLSIASLAYGFLYAICGTELVMCVWIAELSNPFMHARELLKELGFKDTKLSLYNDICFALVFILARMGIGPYLTYVTVSAKNPLAVKVGALGIQIISIYWSYKIVRMAYYKLQKVRKLEKSK